jgi:hypothetical protein
MKKLRILLACAAAILFTLLFHNQAWGLNLLLAETIILTWAIFSKAFKFKGIIPVTSAFALFITALFTVLTHSTFSYVMNLIALGVFIGMIIYPQAKSLLTAIGLSIANFFTAQIQFIEDIISTKVHGRGLGATLWKTRIFTIPLIIILIFLVIYANANPVFMEIIGDISTSVETFFDSLFKNFDPKVILTFILGLWICNLIIFRVPVPSIIQLDKNSTDLLTRHRRKPTWNFKFTGLKNEYKAGIFLLATLNLILLVVNAIDIHWVWFNFEWQGQYLKQFVHEGTYLLILSILISVALVLYFFRGNLNFYTRNRLLKYLGYIWMAQNIILAISVAIRNFYYIHHFAFAYKRIGVIIFLFLTIHGLLTVLIKIHRRKHTFYLLRTNALAIYITLVAASLVNWDSIIARYNFEHAGTAFLHLDFMATLSDKTLPHLDKTLPELMAMHTLQKEKFPFEQKYMTPEAYHHAIQTRKTRFIATWESKNILEWNLPEYLAYRKLKQ